MVATHFQNGLINQGRRIFLQGGPHSNERRIGSKLLKALQAVLEKLS